MRKIETNNISGVGFWQGIRYFGTHSSVIEPSMSKLTYKTLYKVIIAGDQQSLAGRFKAKTFQHEHVDMFDAIPEIFGKFKMMDESS